MINVPTKLLRSGATLPQYATPGSAAVDLFACIAEPIIVAPGETVLIPTGLAFDLDDTGVAALLLPRSGLGANHGIVLGNLVGLCDSDYQGEYGVAIWNRNFNNQNLKHFRVEPGAKICQCMFVRYEQATFTVVEDFGKRTERGEGGFGSTGLTAK